MTNTATERDFLTEFHGRPSQEWVSNVRTEFTTVRAGAHDFPVTINETEYANCWVASPYNAVVLYALEELREVRNRIARTALAGLIHAVAPVLKAARINKVVCVNNWLLSTNLYGSWSGDDLGLLTAKLVGEFPDHVIVFRSLNEATNPELLARFRAERFLLAPSRQIYFCDDPAAALRKQNTTIDHRLLTRKTAYRIVRHNELTADDDARILDLYNQLYLQKYSYQNPQFTLRLIELWRRTGMLQLIGLRSPEGRLDGIVGMFIRGEVITTPLIGYDLSLPSQLGLYRMLTLLVMQHANQTGKVLNLSSGAAQFKRHRGGRPFIEYSAVWCHHLPLFRRVTWRSLAALLQHVGVPVMRHWQL